VAIISRYDLLKEALDQLIDETHLGLVQYGTAHVTKRFNALEFITTRQKKYEMECEVRDADVHQPAGRRQPAY
jgi:hypothetical protein